MSPDQLRERFPNCSDAFIRANSAPVTFKPTDVMKSAPYDGPEFSGVIKQPDAAPVAKKRLRQNASGLNKTEQAFYDFMVGVYGAKAVLSQHVTLRIANGCRYTPDLVLFVSSGAMFAYEVKGFMRDDAAVKLKVAASLYPWIKFHLVTRKPKKIGGGWDIQEVLP